MSAMASQIASVPIVSSTVCSGVDQWTHQTSGLGEWNPSVTGGFPSGRASNADFFHLMTSSWVDCTCVQADSSRVSISWNKLYWNWISASFTILLSQNDKKMLNYHDCSLKETAPVDKFVYACVLFRQKGQLNILDVHFIITTWRGIPCRIAVTTEGVENAYLSWNVYIFNIGPRACWRRCGSGRY